MTTYQEVVIQTRLEFGTWFRSFEFVEVYIFVKFALNDTILKFHCVVVSGAIRSIQYVVHGHAGSTCRRISQPKNRAVALELHHFIRTK
jgi:hypothetical protein